MGKIQVSEEDADTINEIYKFMDCPYASDYGNIWDNADDQRAALKERLTRMSK